MSTTDRTVLTDLTFWNCVEVRAGYLAHYRHLLIVYEEKFNLICQRKALIIRSLIEDLLRVDYI